MFLVTLSVASVRIKVHGFTVQDRPEIFHVSQIVRVNLFIRAKGIQYLPTKACINFRMIGKHGHRECCQTGDLGQFSSALTRCTDERTVSRPATMTLNISSLIIS